MDSVSSPDADTSIFVSPEISAEPVKAEKFRTSVSVSSLAEKFEKARDSVKSEEKLVIEGGLASENRRRRKFSASENNLKDKTDVFEVNGFENKEMPVFEAASKSSTSTTEVCNSFVTGENNTVQDTSKLPRIVSTKFTADQVIYGKNNAQDILKSVKISNGGSVVQEVRDTNYAGDVTQSSTSAVDVNADKSIDIYHDSCAESPKENEVSNAVEERTAFFGENFSQNIEKPDAKMRKNISEQSFTPGEESGKGENNTKYRNEVFNQISLKDLEQSYVNVVSMENAVGIEKAVDLLSVPSIKITEASDQEDSDSDDSEENKSKSEADVVKIRSSDLNNIEESDTKQLQGTAEEPIPSSNIDNQHQKKDVLEDKKRKAIFYISSDLPTESVKEPLENSDESRQRSENQEDFTESDRTEQIDETKEPPGVCSKAVYGAIFFASFIIAIFGFILYTLAHEGKVPQFCELLGMITTIIAGIIGVFSCFCFSFMDAFPRTPFNGYENSGAANIPCAKDVQNLNEESCCSETKEAFRRQNSVSSNSTSEARLRNRRSDHRELIEKTEKLKKEMTGLLDSFCEMMTKMEPLDGLSEMETSVLDTSRLSEVTCNCGK